MSKKTIDADEVESELPAGWWAENDGDHCVHAYSGRGADIDASVTIDAASGGLFTATWNEPGAGRLHGPVDSKSGLKERAVQWVAERAEGMDE